MRPREAEQPDEPSPADLVGVLEAYEDVGRCIGNSHDLAGEIRMLDEATDRLGAPCWTPTTAVA